MDKAGAKGFDQVFEDIQAGGAPRWKVGESVKDWETQHANILEFCRPTDEPGGGKARLIVPLCGDAAYVKYAWEQGYHVTAVEWSEVAVGALKKQFEASGVSFTTATGTAGEGTVVHESDGVRVVQSDWESFAAYALAKEADSFDVIMDKDAFGFFGPVRGKPYAAALSKLLKPKGHVYLEVKERADGSEGPPFHISTDMINDCFASCGVTIVKAFGTQPAPYGPTMTQVAYMLQRQ